jgi:hypothetical protein
VGSSGTFDRAFADFTAVFFKMIISQLSFLIEVKEQKENYKMFLYVKKEKFFP